jgi:hypothetical protein
MVSIPSDNDGELPKIVIEGGSLPREAAWVPKDTVSVHDGVPYMILSVTSRLSCLCGMKLHQLEWIGHVKELRDNECKRVYNAALVAQGSDRGSKRKVSESLTLPDTVGIEIGLASGGTYLLPVLFVSDFRQKVTFQLCENSLNHIVDAIRANTDKGTQRAKMRRGDRFESQFPEVHYSAARGYAFVLWSDIDGTVHRKSRRPWKVKPVDPAEITEQLQQAAEWLHKFYADNHKGPDDVILPADLCDDEADAEEDDADGEGEEDANESHGVGGGPEADDHTSHMSGCELGAPAREDVE